MLWQDGKTRRLQLVLNWRCIAWPPEWQKPQWHCITKPEKERCYYNSRAALLDHRDYSSYDDTVNPGRRDAIIVALHFFIELTSETLCLNPERRRYYATVISRATLLDPGREDTEMALLLCRTRDRVILRSCCIDWNGWSTARSAMLDDEALEWCTHAAAMRKSGR